MLNCPKCGSPLTPTYTCLSCLTQGTIDLDRIKKDALQTFFIKYQEELCHSDCCGCDFFTGTKKEQCMVNNIINAMAAEAEKQSGSDKNAVYLYLKPESWKWLFHCIFREGVIIKNRLEDGTSLGNLWAILQHLEQQFIEKGYHWKEKEE